MSTGAGPVRGLRPVRLSWSSTTMTEPVARSSRMPPTAVVRITTGGPAGDARAHGVDGLGGLHPFVDVAAAAEDQYLAPGDGDGPAIGPVPARRERWEERQGIELVGVRALRQELADAREPAAQHHQNVVVVGPEPSRQLAGSASSAVGRFVHLTIVEGAIAGAA